MNIQQIITELLKENTGVHILDSGGQNGRFWQRNQSKDFALEKRVTLDDNFFIVSLYHYLCDCLTTDDFCTEINNVIEKSEWHWIADVDLDLLPEGIETDGVQYNTYNWNAPFSQDFQFMEFEAYGEKYVLLQVHNGADIRGGYTQVKCFKLEDVYFGYVDVIGTVDGKQCSTMYDGTNLRCDETDEMIEYSHESEYDLEFYVPER